MNEFCIYISRHENRYENGLFDCSLTLNGMYNAIKETTRKLLSDKYIKDSTNVNVYCSPNLRTIQTIIPFCLEYSKEKKMSFKFEDSIYELLDHNIKHYYKFETKPMIKDTHFYYKELKYAQELFDKIKKCEYLRAREICEILIRSLNDPITGKWDHIYPDVSNAIHILNMMIVEMDTMINNKNTDSSYALLLNYTTNVIKIIKNYNVNDYIDNQYKSIIDLNTFWKNNINNCANDHESNSDVIFRTSELVNEIMTNDNYKNSIYVSHSNVISSIVCNILKYIYEGDELIFNFNRFASGCTKETDFVNNFKTRPGQIHKICIDLKNKKIDIHELK